MAADFYSALRSVDTIVHRGFDLDEDRLDAVIQREELERGVTALGQAARRLAEDLRSYPPPENPGILYDGCEGEWEECALVPVRMASTAKAARQAIPATAKKWVLEEPGFYLHCSRRCFLAPSEYTHGDEDWRYSHCRKGDAGAIEFWRVEISERRLSLRRGVDSLVLGVRAYRHQRRGGASRRKAANALWVFVGPQLIRRARFRWNHWRKRRALEAERLAREGRR